MLHAPLATLLLTAGLVAPTPDPPLLPRSTGSTPVTTSPPPPSTAAVTTTPADESTRSAAARAHYAARRYREAAQVYEQLWRDTQAPKYRFNAGMARAAGEHDGAAIVHWQAYLAAAPTIAPAERSMLETEIAAAKRRTLAIQLKIQGPLAPATLTLRAPDGAPQGPRDPIDLVPATAIDLSLEAGAWIATLVRPGRPDAVAEFRVAPDAQATITLGADTPAPVVAPPTPAVTPTQPPATLTLELGPRRALARSITVTVTGPGNPAPRTLRDATTPWSLPAGAWTLRATAPDRRPAEATVTVAPGETRRLPLHLRPDRATQTRLGLGLGLGGAGLVLLTTGIGVTARGARDYAVLRDTDQVPTCLTPEVCTRASNAVLDLSNGLALIGTGLGFGVTAATAASRARDRALTVEAGVGGVLFVAGLSWYLAEIRGTYELDDRARDHAAATTLGLGAGLLGGAAVGLVTRRLVRRQGLSRRTHAISPLFVRQGAGLSLRASF